ncbi:MAG: ATP-binding protein [Chloroflexota bacterium]|nr:ATP-binding protein [Chloroflexota bacterium]
MRRLSLTTRLILSHLLATATALLLLGSTLVFLVVRDQRLQVLATLDAQAAVYAAYAGELAPTTAILEGLADGIVQRFPREPGTKVRIFATNGSLLTSDRSLGEFPSRAVQPLIVTPAPFLPLATETRRYVAKAIIRDSQPIGIVEVSRDTAAEVRLRRNLLLALLPGSLLAATGALLLANLLARTLLRPLHALRRVASAIAAGELGARSGDRSSDEIGQLAGQINRMAAELEARFDEIERLAKTRREFYRSISHELRTPLTAIRGMAENLEDGAAPEQQRSLEIIQAETDRLQCLVEELLAGGDGSFALLRQRQPVELAELARDVVELMQPRAARASIQLRYDGEDRGTIAGDRDRLKQALVNVLDNALKWTPPGGDVLVRTYEAPLDGAAGIAVSVADSGPGIPDELRATVWQRGTRGRDGSQGLGLALVHEVVQAHGGAASLGDGPGTTVELRFPRAEARQRR